MSKNLEREYRALVNSEVPDLWARIEAGLEDKKAAPEKADTDLHITDFPVTDSQLENIRDKKVNFKVWAGLAAACVCAALVLPAMTRSLTMSGGTGSNNSAPNYSAPQVAEEPYGKTEGAIQEEAAATAYEDIDNVAAAAENGINNNTVTSDHTNTVADSNIDMVNVASGGLEETAEEEQEPFIFHATVEILDMDDRMDSGILYTAKVIRSENPNLQVGSEIRVLSSAVTAEGVMALENSETYDLTLCEEHSDDSGQEKTYLLVNDTVE
ncbi:MAG: hypothetical protein K2O91_18545 [Lachnospiraceae bacterium]|nr:hypothetical protein [Lachnospiraceae bacterium]